jgi:hypothetical protein
MAFTATTTDPVDYSKILGRWDTFNPGSLSDADLQIFYKAGQIVGDIVRSGDVAPLGTPLKVVVVSASDSLAITVSES